MGSTSQRFFAALAVLMAVAFPAGVAGADGLDAVRDATRAFRDIAVAEAAGYGILSGTPLEQCIAEPGEGAMGFHYVNGDLVGDAVLEPTMPEALLYVPRPDGSLRLAGVEYVVFADAWNAENSEPPSLFGRDFHLVSEPNRYELPPFYELHAWVWADNPSGTFNDWNPGFSCLLLPDTAMAATNQPGQATLNSTAALLIVAFGVSFAAAVVLRRRHESAP